MNAVLKATVNYIVSYPRP